MAIATMPMTDQEMPPANDLGDRTPREENEERQAQETVSTLRDANEDISTPEAHIPEPDQAVGEESQETPSQEMDNELPDASLHECRVEMVPLDDIYAGSDPYDDELNDDLIKALAHSIGLIGFYWLTKPYMYRSE